MVEAVEQGEVEVQEQGEVGVLVAAVVAGQELPCIVCLLLLLHNIDGDAVDSTADDGRMTQHPATTSL